jgi:hypothetical protein
MPFSEYGVDADLMEAMHDAFQRVCDILRLSGDRDDPLTEIVVTKIVGLAKAGERDPEILCIDVLSQLPTGNTTRATCAARTDACRSGERAGLKGATQASERPFRGHRDTPRDESARHTRRRRGHLDARRS